MSSLDSDPDRSNSRRESRRSGGYLDAASGTWLNPAAEQAWLAALEQGWADPRRAYHQGRHAALLLDAAREEIAAGFGASAGQVEFTTSGTAALAAAVERFAPNLPADSTVVTSAVEHSAVPRALDRWSGPTRTVGVDRMGRIDPAEFAASLGSRPGLAVLQHVNQEVGTVQPIEQVASLIGPCPLLVDAGASVGRVELPEGWAVMTASAAKWGGPLGIGVVVDRHHRASTGSAGDEWLGRANVPAAVAAAAGLSWIMQRRELFAAGHRKLIAELREQLPVLISDVEVVGDPLNCAPHILNFSCLYVDGEALVQGLDRRGIAVSSGSACAGVSGEPSHVLAAMGVLTHGNIRVSLPFDDCAPEVTQLLQELPGLVRQLRADLP